MKNTGGQSLERQSLDKVFANFFWKIEHLQKIGKINKVLVENESLGVETFVTQFKNILK